MRLAVLFGSQASGRARPDSDVDIAIVPQDTSSSLWDEGRWAADLEAALARSVDLVRLDLAPILLQWEVFKDGVLLFADPPEEWAKHIIRVMAEHADYAPAAERVGRSFLRCLADSRTP